MAQQEALEKGRRRRAGQPDELLQGVKRNATRASSLRETHKKLEQMEEALHNERAIRMDQETQINKLKENANIQLEELKVYSNTLTEEHAVLLDITNCYEKEKRRKNILEKRIRAVNAKASRLQENKIKLTEKNATNQANQSKLDSELAIAYEQRQLESMALLAEIDVLRGALETIGLQLHDEANRHTETKDLLDQEIQKATQLRNQLNKSRAGELKLTQRLKYIQRTRGIYYCRLKRAKRKIYVLEKYKKSALHTLTLMEKGTYTPHIRSFIRKIVVLSCPMISVGPIIDNFYQIMMKPLLDPSRRPDKVCPDQRTVAQIISEGGVAAEIQSGVEMICSDGKLLKYM